MVDFFPFYNTNLVLLGLNDVKSSYLKLKEMGAECGVLVSYSLSEVGICPSLPRAWFTR